MSTSASRSRPLPRERSPSRTPSPSRSPKRRKPNSPQTPTPLAMLSDLPTTSPTAFSNFDPSLPADSFHLYLPSPADVPPTATVITTEKRRCLIRALLSRSASTPKRAASVRSPPRPTPASVSVASPAPRATTSPLAETKRPRWTSLDRERKQACLRVALSAACRTSPAGSPLHQLRDGWARNPRLRQLVDLQVRRLLADSVPTWNATELREYLSRANIPRVLALTRPELVSIVVAHLAPEVAAARR